MRQLGLNPALINALRAVTSIDIVVPLSCAGVARFIMWRGGRSALALATATSLLLYGLVIGSDNVTQGLGPHPYEARGAYPDADGIRGRAGLRAAHLPHGPLRPGWAAWLVAAEWLVIGGLGVTVGLDGDPAALTLLVITGLGLGLQVYRFRRAASPVEQQQLNGG